MKNLALAGSILLLPAAAVPLAAQTPNLGVAVNVCVPTGGFNNTNYADGSSEGYDTNLGAQFTLSFPVDRNFALRLNVGGVTFTGDGNLAGMDYRDPTATVHGNLQDSMWSVGGEAQLFFADGNAMRHVGSYFIGGLSLDFERFSWSQFNDPNFYPDAVTNKTRLGADVGFGHSFRGVGRWRWTLEGVYHTTLTNADTNAGDPPASSFVKVSVGMIF